jgi:hypothetical protein
MWQLRIEVTFHCPQMEILIQGKHNANEIINVQ